MQKNLDFSIFIGLVLFFTLAQYVLAVYPLSHEKCNLQDSDCLRKQAQATVRAFVEGVPEHGIKKLDKMEMDHVEVKAHKLHYEMWNTTVEGFNNTIIDDISIQKELKIMHISFHTNLVVTCDYNADGEVFAMPINGNGKAELIMNNLQVDLVILFDIVKNDEGKDIMDLKTYFFGADAVDGVHYYFENLFNGDKVKGDKALAFMNKSWRTIVANYGRFFTIKVMDDIFEAIKIYMRSCPLEDLALY
ncbi:jg14694 [Pararge aegeria aegeria]|uniref:Jg14694 protein n=1 Tax=Pararge aegeria aegeria TaxID=348720 RepID=A0A8S4SMN2_9NEOP|nr:jg14694 [Pararge aegeria aegeria]